MSLVPRFALRVALAAAALTAAALTAAGCSSAPSGPAILSWQLADGRDCFTAGVTAVEVRAARSLATQPLAAPHCTDGIPPASFTVTDAPGDGTLYLDGVDSLGTDLYHGQLSLDANPPGTGETRLVTLYAAAAE
jgi:hypothetical protein